MQTRQQIAVTTMKTYHLFFTLVVALLLVGCASAKYSYGNQTFHSPDAALAKQAADLSAILQGVNPTTAPVHGKALVVLPSRDELRKRYIRSSGYAVGLRKEHFDYFCALLDNDQEMLTNAIRKRRLFDELTETHAADPAAAGIAENDFLIYRDVDGWFVKNQKSAQKNIEMNAQTASGLPRTLSFLESLEQAARSLSQ